ncbi:hypothetical protein C0Q70_06072 [Pomacea canaliculata]|uniref:FHF complex subunit HOOK-interacting protein C-terminal domain-containing protein n=1 Tax=Pomacea canaliculata TaxID=400727 RepID=A0A2T7PN01_POMCA|nr:hypothetical protein C0Q70_06072 [Pomacea canaliculata]
MSWFKRTSSVREDARTAVNGSSSLSSNNGNLDPMSTDPDLCFEVFKNHWQQACSVISGNRNNGSSPSNDDLEMVVHNFEQMITLLVGEESIDGMPGPIANFLLEKEVLENFCNWCSSQQDHQDKLRMEQLRMYELLISQSRQLLLIHRPVIRPLHRLLMACKEPQLPSSGSEELEFRLVLVLHQICTCISQETVILESFFSTEADHGPAKFLIFSLLIPYIHREGPIGQRARDALLLLMTLSARHPHIGYYIADNSDFCPVLATGLSGLYSSLPRKITPSRDDWCALTEEDCQRIPDLQMFLNSLEFCNAVVQVAHEQVRDQLIKFIYTGFLLPVLGPALHQTSRDEVMTATAYLDLFLRRISEPHLIKAFLRFVLMERHDEMLILESLISRIGSNSKLSLVSLSLFNTLVEMNCEEVMFQLVFRYLIPCTHVMVSQRRSVRDIDLYGKSAEKFLSLRPVCCMTYPTTTSAGPTPSPSPIAAFSPPQTTVTPGRAPLLSRTNFGRSASISTPGELISPASRQEPRRRSSFFKNKKEKKKMESLSEEQRSAVHTALSASNELASSQTEDLNVLMESSYTDYLHEAQITLKRCAQACQHWSAPYDGENPAPGSVFGPNVSSRVANGDSTWSEPTKNLQKENANAEKNNNIMPPSGNKRQNSVAVSQKEGVSQQVANKSGEKTATDWRAASSSTVVRIDPLCNKALSSSPLSPTRQSLSKLSLCLDNLDSFLTCLNDLDLQSQEVCSKTDSLEEVFSSFEQALFSVTYGVKSDFNAKASTESRSLSSMGSIGPKLEEKVGHLEDRSMLVSERQRSSYRSSDDFSRPLPVSPTSPGMSLSPTSTSSTGQHLPLTSVRYSSSPPNIGPFLSAVFGRLEGMVQNSLYANLLLTGLVSRLAAYPHPLLRSFLLNVNLVFQPTVKSLVQVLSSVRQKVDSYAVTTRNFSALLNKARGNLKMREDYLISSISGGHSVLPPSSDYMHGQPSKPLVCNYK